MERPSLPLPSNRSRATRSWQGRLGRPGLVAIALCASLAARPAGASGETGPMTQAPRAGVLPGGVMDSLARALAAAGFRNVVVAPLADSLSAAYENVRWRHSAEALGRARAVLARPMLAIEERLALPSAALWTETERWPVNVDVVLPAGAPSISSGTLERQDSPLQTRFRVAYPCDPDYPGTPAGSRRRPSWQSVDLVFGPLFDYELGRIFDPILYRLQIQGTLRYVPWPGALARLGIVIPWLDNFFGTDPLHPDVADVRPGPMSLEQFAWIPYAGLLSATGGYFGDNRYGASVGLARPLSGGRLMFDGQVDLSGFLAFGPAGMEYSTPSHRTGYGALIWRPGLDIAAKVKAATFLYGDRGVELEVRRTFGDLDVGVFGQRTAGDNVVGLRLGIPFPPVVRPAGRALRVMPVERFNVDYHSRSGPVGRDLPGVPSREAYLRQLDEPSLDANLPRLERSVRGAGRGRAAGPREKAPPELISLHGMSGFVNTPWAGTVPDRRLEAGYSKVPKGWADDHRGQYDNEIYYLTLGFLPRIEGSIRWTVLPGLKTFQGDAPESELTDTDYMASGRLNLVPPRPGRPGLAVGAEDLKGTRRFQATYAVAGLPLRIGRVQSRVSLGYAFRALEASHRTLLGTFGAVEIRPVDRLALQSEYDTEKWNVGLGVAAPYGIRLRAVLLNMETLSVGLGFGITL